MSTLAQPLAYTDAEVASLLRVSKRTVYRLRKSGALPAARIGKMVRTPATAVMQFLQAAAQPESREAKSDNPSKPTVRVSGKTVRDSELEHAHGH